jgi:lipoyl(octanoyl) transferase
MSANDHAVMAADHEAVLCAYLLGEMGFEEALTLQRALVFQVGGERQCTALVLCEHRPMITVGRHGSPSQILYDLDELRSRRWPVRWVNRGGSCLLHLPGQLALYSIVALDRYGLGVEAYLERLRGVLASVLDDFGIRAGSRDGDPGLWVGNRLIAALGVAVHDWVAYFGAFFNVNPDLAPFRLIRNGGPGDGPMTSLERERRGPLRTALVRQRLVRALRHGLCLSAHQYLFPASSA